MTTQPDEVWGDELLSTHECEADDEGDSTCGGDFQCEDCGKWFGWCMGGDGDERCNGCWHASNPTRATDGSATGGGDG